MKKLFTGIIICLTALCAGAQTTRPHRMHQRPNFAMHQLNLSAEQKEKLKALNADFRKKMQELNKKEDITVRDMRNQKAALFAAHRQDFENLLTPEQKGKLKEAGKKSAEKRQAMQDWHIDRLKKTINLTDDQAIQLKKVNEDFHTTWMAIRNNQSLSPEDKRMQAKTLSDAHHEAMQQIFTQEQKDKLQEMHTHRMHESAK